MKSTPGKAVVAVLVMQAVSGPISSRAQAEHYEAMRDVDPAKIVFDMRDGVPKIAAVHMKLMHDTYTQLVEMKKRPTVVVVFIASAVKLLSSDRSAFGPEDQKYLEEMDHTISRMLEDDILFEVCLAAVDYFEVDPGSIPPEIEPVANGWISLLGYQGSGFELIPVY